MEDLARMAELAATFVYYSPGDSLDAAPSDYDHLFGLLAESGKGGLAQATRKMAESSVSLKLFTPIKNWSRSYHRRFYCVQLDLVTLPEKEI